MNLPEVSRINVGFEKFKRNKINLNPEGKPMFKLNAKRYNLKAKP